LKALFNDILNLDSIHGIILLSRKGERLFEAFPLSPPRQIPTQNGWQRLVQTLEGIREADLLFGKKRIYIRKVAPGYLLITMGTLAPVAMVRLNCDMLLPSLEKVAPKGKGLKSFFKKGK